MEVKTRRKERRKKWRRTRKRAWKDLHKERGEGTDEREPTLSIRK